MGILLRKQRRLYINCGIKNTLNNPIGSKKSLTVHHNAQFSGVSHVINSNLPALILFLILLSPARSVGVTANVLGKLFTSSDDNFLKISLSS
jgi:hypothetical protein